MKLLRVEDVAEMLSVAVSTVYEMVSKGEIPGFRLGPRKGAIRIEEADVIGYLESCKVGKKQPERKPRRIKSRHFSV